MLLLWFRECHLHVAVGGALEVSVFVVVIIYGRVSVPYRTSYGGGICIPRKMQRDVDDVDDVSCNWVGSDVVDIDSGDLEVNDETGYG